MKRQELINRCEAGITGHVFKSTKGEVGDSLKCMCGTVQEFDVCVRCGTIKMSDRHEHT